MTTVPINLNMVKLDAELAQVDPIPSDAALARLWERATRELERAVPRVSARLATGEVSFEDVGDVLTAMVLRVLRNPIGARSVGIDDAQVTIDQSLSSGELYVSASERAALAPKSTGRRWARTIQLGLSEYQTPQSWV